MLKKMIVILLAIAIFLVPSGNTYLLTSNYSYAYSRVKNINVYYHPDIEAQIIGTIMGSGAVIVFDALTYTDGAQWAKVAYGMMVGYVIANSLIFTDSAGIERINKDNNLQPTMVYGENITSFPNPIDNVMLIDNYEANDMRIDVFDAPGTSSHHSKTAKGTAAYVSVNEGITLLAKDEGWCLIEYRTKTGHRRGYIPGNCVPQWAYSSVGFLPKAGIECVLDERTDLINDVTMMSDNYKTSLSKGTRITYLAITNTKNKEWVYVEAMLSGRRIRGFILLDKFSVL